MNIEIIISEDDNELLRGEYLTWDTAAEGLEKLQRKFEEEQAKAEEEWKNHPGTDGEPY